MARLGDIATVITKGTTPTSIGFVFQNEGINFVKIESVDENGNFICEKFDHISDECHEKLKRSQLQENDILFSIAGAIGRTAIVTKEILPANTNQALAIIRIPHGTINYSFLLYILQSSVVLKQADKKKQGVAQLNLSLKDIGDFVIPDLPLEKQQEIVDNLDKVSNLIYLRKQQLSKLDELVKSRFIEMFGDRGQNPFNYPTTTMGDVYKFQYGKGNNIPEDKGEYLCYGSNGVVGHHTEYNSEDSPIIGHIGAYAGIVNWGKGKHYVTYNGVICKLIHDKVNPVYGFYLLQLQDYNTVAKAGAAQPFVSYKDLEVPVVNIPSLERQNQFAAFVEQTDKSKFEIQKSLEKLETLKKALMQKYFG